MTDKQKIQIAKRLYIEGYIDLRTLAELKCTSTTIIDDVHFPVDICDNGDVYIHGGTYPIILRGYNE